MVWPPGALLTRLPSITGGAAPTPEQARVPGRGPPRREHAPQQSPRGRTSPCTPPDTPPLSTEECTAQFAGLNDACCTPAKYCRTGIPERCSRTCVDPFLALYRDCYPTLQSVQNVDTALYDQLHDMCVVEQNRGAPGGGH